MITVNSQETSGRGGAWALPTPGRPPLPPSLGVGDGLAALFSPDLLLRFP